MERQHLLLVVDLHESLSADELIQFIKPLTEVSKLHISLVCRTPSYPATLYQLPSFASRVTQVEKQLLMVYKQVCSKLTLHPTRRFLYAGKHQHDVKELAKRLKVSGVVYIYQRDSRQLEMQFKPHKLSKKHAIMRKLKHGVNVKSKLHFNFDLLHWRHS